MKSRLIALMALMVLGTCGLVSAQTLSLDHADGLLDATHLDTGVPVTFYIRLTGDGDTHSGITNGFRVFSNDGAIWTPMVGDTTGTLGKSQFDGGFFISPFSVTGSNADTIGFGAFRFFGTGLPASFDDVVYTIDIGPIAASEIGKTICLDSTYYPPSGVWKWAGPDVFPGWSGPHCFTVGSVSNPVLNLPDMVADNCDTACIPITVGSFSGVAGVELHLSFDTSCLTCESIDVGYLAGATVSCGDGAVHIIWDDFVNPLTLADGETLASVCFSGLSETPCPVGFSATSELVDELGDPLTVDHNDGSLAGECDPVPELELILPDMMADNCDTACIPITVGSFSGVAGVELHLSFDTSCLTCESIDVGYLAGATVSCGDGAVHIIWDDFVNPLTLADGETLASVCFSGLSDTPCPVGFSATSELVDELGDPLTVTYNDGSLSCTPGAPCVTTVTSPNGGEVWTVGDAVQIGWTFTDGTPADSCDCLATVDISFDGGATWVNIGSSVAGNTLNWTVTNNPSTNCLIRVCCAAAEPICDVSDAPFTIQALQGGDIILTLPDMIADNCDTACIPITVLDFSGVAGVELHLNYDASCMTCTGIDPGQLVGATVNCGSGSVHIIWDDFVNPLTLPDGATLASVCFTGLSSAACSIGFDSSTELVDELGDPLAVTYNDGSLAGVCGPCVGPAICLDHVDGLNPAGNLVAGGNATFHLRVKGDADEHGGVTNGFEVSSPNGATWTTTVGDTTGTLGKTQFDGGFFINPFSITGSGADTVAFSAFRFFGTGLPPAFDAIAYTVDIGPIGGGDGGKIICLDSAYFPPSGVWKWAGVDVFPSWDGPHCFDIEGEPPTCSLVVTSPSAGDSLMGGSGTNITWVTSNCDGCVYHIEYSGDNGVNWSTVATGVAGNSYAWTVPGTTTNAGLIRVCCVDSPDCDVSGQFTVYEPVVVEQIVLTVPDVVVDGCASGCVPIVVESFTGVAGVELHMEYDESCLTCDVILEGYLVGATVNCGGGEIHIIWDDFANPLTLADGETLAQICFTGLSESPCPIGFLATSELVDELGDPFADVMYYDGSLRCDSTGPCESPFTFTPTAESGVFRGQATIEGVPAEAGDWVAAFDEDGNCAGAVEVTINVGLAYIILPIYGDDLLTPGVDEGMNAGENFTLKIFDCSEEMILDYCGVFDCWVNTNGTPLPGPCGDVTNVYDFQTDFQDVIALKAGWNLISFDILFGADDPASVFASLGACLIYVTDFDGGSHYYDPNGPAFLNTLTQIRPGYGFWVKVCDDIVLTVDGVCTYPCNFSLDLDNGWNLIAYWPQATVTPQVAFADLISAGALVYVTGFDGGSQYFDPNGPAFLNTLTQIRNGYGYWVKVNAAWPGFQYEECDVAGVSERPIISDLSLNKERSGQVGPFAFSPTNLSAALTGSVTIDDQAAEEGDVIAAFDGAGKCVGAAILFKHNGEAYFSMPIYGDDQTTPSVVEGMTSGENYHLKLFDATENALFEHGVEMAGWVNTNGAPLGEPEVFNFASAARLVGEVPDHYSLSQNYPNPFNPKTTIRFGLPTSAQVEIAVYNIVGQRVTTLVNDYYQGGYHETEWNSTDENGNPVSSGIYFYRLKTDANTETKKMLLLK